MKKINMEDFANAKADFITNIKLRKPQSWDQFNNELSLYCTCMGLPVIVAVMFAKQDFPEYLEQLERKEKIVQEFYEYEQ